MEQLAVGLEDFEFDHASRWTRTEGRGVRRWIPLGMPRVPTKFEKCVFYLYGLNPMTGKLEGPGATGCFVAWPSEELTGEYHLYAVSNRHAVSEHSCIRVNAHRGNTAMIDREPHEWLSRNGVDLAATDVTDDLNPNAHDFGLIYSSDFLTDDRAAGFEVGIGDQVFMMGLFADHNGGRLNVPAARFGNIAAMPHVDRRVSLFRRDPYAMPCYLNDMRSRSGFSGSPVWVWRTPSDDLNFYGPEGSEGTAFVIGRTFLCFLGIHRGQFQERTTVLSAETVHTIKHGTELQIASAMTVVIPADEIRGLLYDERFAEQRRERDKRSERIERAQGRVSMEYR